MNQIDLKELELKAFRSTFQDGLWDIYLGLIVICMSFFLARPETGFSPWNIFLMVFSFFGAFLVFFLGKRFITVPRMGQVVFGPTRKRKLTTLAIILGVVVLVHAGIVAITVGGNLNQEWAAKINTFLQVSGTGQLVVAAIGSFFVGPSMILVAYFNDFLRGYYIAILMMLTVFLMILLNKPVFALIIGGLIILPGLFLFVRFLQKYPLHKGDVGHE